MKLLSWMIVGSATPICGHGEPVLKGTYKIRFEVSVMRKLPIRTDDHYPLFMVSCENTTLKLALNKQYKLE